MTRAKISEYSATANDNTDVNGVNIAEGCPPSSMNNMGREIMAALKRFQVGSDGDGVTVGGALVVSGATTLTTVSATVVQSDTVNEKTSAAGVTIDGVLLKDNGVVTGAGTVSAPVYSTTGDTNTGIFFPAADTIAFAEGGAEAMRINSSGNVELSGGISIGATSAGNTVSSIFAQNNSDSANTACRIVLQPSTTFLRGAVIQAVNSGASGQPTDLFFATNSAFQQATERARITSGGAFKASTNGVYVDATSLQHEFVQSNNANTVLIESNNASLTGNGVLFLRASRNTTDNTFYILSYFNVGADSFKFRVADSGNVTNTNNSYGSISDVKLKQDIVDAGSQWDDIKNLRIRKYRWKSEPEGFMQLGLVAQEAEEVSPGLIEEHPDKKEETRTREVEKTREVEVTPAVLDEDGNVVEPAVMETETYTEEEEYTETVDLGTTTKSVKYSVLYMKAVKALQEAMERIETLEAKVSALEAK